MTQIILHLIEPFLHRYLIRGTFSQRDSIYWHTSFLWLWAGIYLHYFSVAPFEFMVLVKAVGLRFVSQSIVLNYLMVRDGHEGRTWHDLRDIGIEGTIQEVMRYPTAWIVYRMHPDNVTSNLRLSTEKVTIITGVIVTAIILML